MYLQLADNENTPVAYKAVTTSHGTVYVRPDYPMLSAKGAVKLAINKTVAKVAPKAANVYSMTGLPASAQVTKAANIVATKAASGQPLLPPKVAATIKAAAQKTVGKAITNVKTKIAAKKAGRQAPATSAPIAPEQTAPQVQQDTTKNKFMQFIDTYKKPLLYTAGGLAIAGVGYAVIKNKRKKK